MSPEQVAASVVVAYSLIRGAQRLREGWRLRGRMTEDKAYDLAWAAGQAHARAAGREVWAEEDREACLREYERCLSLIAKQRNIPDPKS